MRKRRVKVFALVVLLACVAFGSTWLQKRTAYAADEVYPVQQARDGNWYYFRDGAIDWSFNGLAPNAFGWWKVTNGAVDFTFNDVAANAFGWWKVTNGAVDFGFNGLASNEFGWWKITNGAVDFGFNGVEANEFGWWKVTNGAIDFGYNGVASNEFGWWKITNGAVDFGFNGVEANEFGWWKVTNGAIDFGYNGVASNEFGWWKITNGAVDFGYIGLAPNEFGWWKVTNGAVDFGYNGVAMNTDNGTWWYVQGGQVMFNYDGLAQNPDNGTWWYVRGGQVIFDYNGTTEYGGRLYVIQNGQVIFDGAPAEDNNNDGTYTVGTQVTGSIANGVYMIRSSQNKDYALTAVEDRTAEGGMNLVMAKITGEESQKFFVVKTDDGNYCFMSMKYYDGNGTNADKKWLIATTHFGWPEDGSKRDNVQVMSDAANSGKAWQLTETASGEYMINALRGDGSMFYLTADGGVSQNTNVITAEAGNTAEQTFNFVRPYTQSLTDGLYKMVSAQDNKAVAIAGASLKDYASVVTANEGSGFEQLFYITCVDANNGLYVIRNYQSQRYFFTQGSREIGAPILQSRDYDAGDKKWYVKKNTDGTYSFVSANSEQVVTAQNGVIVQTVGNDSAAQKFILKRTSADMNVTFNGSAKTVAEKYDLTALNGLDADKYNATKIKQRLNTLHLTREELLTPEAAMVAVENNVKANVVMPTEKVSFSGSTVTELNEFLVKNKGKVVQLTRDILVSIDKYAGVIQVPTNTVLDGNGHSLVLAPGAKAPIFGIAFYYNDISTNYRQTVSSNCGVINLTSAIDYDTVTLNSFGADNILIENNNFSNSNMSIALSDQDNNNPVVNAIIRGNKVSNTKKDGIGVYGNDSNIIIENNTVTGCGEFGIMVSCLRDGTQTPVEQEVDGPHDVIVRNNEVSDSQSCMYALGAYKTYVVGNHIHDSQNEGICFDSGCIGCYFADNTVHDNGKTRRLPGVSFDNSIYNIVSNNYVYNNAFIGIKLVRSCYGTIIVDNVCESNSRMTPDGTTNSGISIESKNVDPENYGCLDDLGSDYNIVMNNQIRGTHIYGICISQDSANGQNNGNIVKYNTISSLHSFANVDFSNGQNEVSYNVIQ